MSDGVFSALNYLAKRFGHSGVREPFWHHAGRLRELASKRWEPPPLVVPIAPWPSWGKGYAIVSWPEQQIWEMRKDPESLARIVLGRLVLGAEGLAKELDVHLSGGPAEDRDFAAIHNAAHQSDTGVAWGVEGIGTARPDDVFLHAGTVPELVADDGLVVSRCAAAGYLAARIRVFGIVQHAQSEEKKS